jgi:hypothetical protein
LESHFAAGRGTEPIPCLPRLQQRGGKPMGGAKMNQWLLNLPPFESYLIAIPAIMVGSVLLVGAIVLLFEPHDEGDRDARRR